MANPNFVMAKRVPPVKHHKLLSSSPVLALAIFLCPPKLVSLVELGMDEVEQDGGRQNGEEMRQGWISPMIQLGLVVLAQTESESLCSVHFHGSVPGQ